MKSYHIIGLLFLGSASFSQTQATQDSIHSRQDTYAESHALVGQGDDHDLAHSNLKRGERLFYGLVGSGDNTINCASCHYTYELDTLNWNPSAVEIALTTAGLDSAAYANLLLYPSAKKMTQAHEGIDLTGEEIVLIRHYLEEFRHEGLTQRKPNVNRMIFFVFLIVVIFVVVTDLTITKMIKWKSVAYIALLLSLTWATKMIVQDAIALGRSKNYAPLQPIKFSHVIHAGEDQIDCQYCHHTAETSKSAGLPAMDLCLNCHVLIREGTRSGKYEINKIHASMESGHPVEWVRVHRLPDFVFFSHAQHVGAGKLDCVECHGVVEEMDVLQQHSDLSMRWCIECHRTRKVDFLDNEYYPETFREYHEKISQGLMDSVTVEQIGGTDCMKCHY